MQLSRKQTILIVTLSGVAVLLLVGLLLLLYRFKKSEPIPKEPSVPSAAPTETPETPSPSPTPAPTETPAPTPYFLPLVPGGTLPSASPLPAAPSFSPSPAPASGSPQAEGAPPRQRDGVYNDQIKEFMAIGTQNGEAIAVLLVRVAPPETTIVAIPSETLTTVYTLGSNASVERVDAAPLKTATARAENAREGCWNLVWAVKNLLGYRAPEYLCVDFSCMDAFFSFAPTLFADGAMIDLDTFMRMLDEPDETRAASMAQFGVGLVQYLNEVSLWDLPAFKKATRGAFSSSLSVFELLGLMADLKKTETFTIAVLPTELKNGVRMLSDAAVLPF